jgi:hypothetical protein
MVDTFHHLGRVAGFPMHSASKESRYRLPVSGIGDVLCILLMCSTAANCDQLVDLGEMTGAIKSVMACVEWRTKLRIYVDDLPLSPVTI